VDNGQATCLVSDGIHSKAPKWRLFYTTEGNKSKAENLVRNQPFFTILPEDRDEEPEEERGAERETEPEEEEPERTDGELIRGAE